MSSGDVMDMQKTIKGEVTLTGIGLHTGSKVTVTFKAAPADSGVTFVRIDLPDKPAVKASVDCVPAYPQGRRRTTISSGIAGIHTVEHLMAALSALGIDNLAVELNGEELPGLDGSALEYLEAMDKAGIQTLDKPRDYYALKEPIHINESGVSLVALPSDTFRVSYTLNYDHPVLSSQFLDMEITEESFREGLAGARTFCLEEEAEELKKQGLGKGATYENTLVVGEKGVIDNTLRFPDEFVRHKVLDLIGDFSLLGRPLKAHIIAVKSGHALNARMVKAILQQQQKSAAGVDVCSGEGCVMDVQAIMGVLPHRFPFLLVDRITYLEEGKRIVGVKNVTINDAFFQGHFPGKPVMPGVLILEAMAQVGGVMMLSSAENRGKLAYFMAIDGAKFRKVVVPGDRLVMEITAGKVKSRTGQVFGKAYVDGKVVAEATLMFAFG